MSTTTDFNYNFDPEDIGRHTRSKTRTLREANFQPNSLPRAKRRKFTSRRKTKPTPRKNRPYSNVHNLSLQCCTEKTCLLECGHEVIAAIRQDFDGKLYDEQNAFLVSLIDIQPKVQKKRIIYNIRDDSGLRKVKVCKKAFLKILGIGKKRIAVLVKKIQPYSGQVQEDQRRNNRNQKRLPLALKAQV